MQRLFILMLVVGLVFPCLASGVPSQASDELEEGLTLHNKSGKKESKITPGDSTESVKLRVSGTLESGRILFTLRDPQGQERWAKEINESSKGTYTLETKSLTPARGTWVLEVEMVNATGSYNTSWTLR